MKSWVKVLGLVAVAITASYPLGNAYQAPVKVVKAEPPAQRDIVKIRYWPIFLEVAGPVEGRRLAAQCLQESQLNPSATSHSGARGLCQFMPSAWDTWGNGKDINDPRANIEAAHRYMQWLLAKTGGDFDKALAAYNSGLGNLRRAERLHREVGDTDRRAWLNKYYPRVLGDRAKETQGYVRKINASLNDWSDKDLAPLV